MRQQIKKKIHPHKNNTIQNSKNTSLIRRGSHSRIQKQFLNLCRTILNYFQIHAKTLKQMKLINHWLLIRIIFKKRLISDHRIV